MASIPTKTFYSTRPRLSLSKAEAILEAIASQDNSDLDLSDDELNETSIQVPQPDVSSSDDSDEQDSDSEPSTSMGKFPPWRHAPFVSSLPDIPDTPDAVGFETLVKTLLSKLRKVKRQQKRLKNKLDTGVQITKEFKEETLKKRGSLVDVAQSLHAYSGSHHLVLCTASTCFMQEGSLHHIYISKNIGAQDKHFLCKYLSFYTSSMN
ncbi:uncharacterized protein LOC142557118 isoform X1 [Dermacentor variabilis]|uniref:uncharacterized protein LOC142557118 isoform X1 n=1 Tax=Dermacentor variabilis TaxID=34621 RepID=UPI003F5C1615